MPTKIFAPFSLRPPSRRRLTWTLTSTKLNDNSIQTITSCPTNENIKTKAHTHFMFKVAALRKNSFAPQIFPLCSKPCAGTWLKNKHEPKISLFGSLATRVVFKSNNATHLVIQLVVWLEGAVDLGLHLVFLHRDLFPSDLLGSVLSSPVEKCKDLINQPLWKTKSVCNWHGNTLCPGRFLRPTCQIHSLNVDLTTRKVTNGPPASDSA